jgi:hypothetical protein
MDFQTMNKQRKYILIAAAVGVVSMFLPWLKISIFGIEGSMNGMHDKGIIVFICFVVAGGLAFMGDQTTNLTRTSWFIALVCGALATLMMLWFLLDISGNIDSSFIGFGFYLSALSAIAVLVSAYLFRAPGDDIKSGFDSLKSNIEQKTKNDSPNNP